MSKDTNHPVNLRINAELRARIDARKPQALSRNAWYAWLLERQIAFEERKGAKPYVAPQPRQQAAPEPTVNSLEQHWEPVDY